MMDLVECETCEFEPGHGGLDPCVRELISVLNNNGFKTIASCCGHGQRPGIISLADGRELVIARNFQEAIEI
jgi:hypothetical protein